MKVLVPIKRVIDANIKVRVNADQSGVELNNVKMAMNPFCEIAVEEAIRLREGGKAEEVIAVAVGPSQSQETLRTALAMGADRAILIETDPAPEPLGVAKLLKAVTEKENPGLVILGKQAIDGDNNQTGQMLAALLDWSIGTFVSGMEVNDGSVRVTREVDGGLETFSPDDLGVDVSPRIEVLKVIEPPARAAGVKVSSAEELVEKLRNEAKVI